MATGVLRLAQKKMREFKQRTTCYWESTDGISPGTGWPLVLTSWADLGAFDWFCSSFVQVDWLLSGMVIDHKVSDPEGETLIIEPFHRFNSKVIP